MAVQILGIEAYYALSPPYANSGSTTKEYAAQNKFWTGPGAGVVQETVLINARPNILRTLPNTLQKFADGLSKILIILERLNIAFDKEVVHCEKIGAF